jgi:DUF2934 family protein
MPSSAPSQAKAGRSKDGKTNGSTARAASATEQQTASTRPSNEDIARRAYEIYEREGRQPGTELQNWLKAEAELSGSTKGH